MRSVFDGFQHIPSGAARAIGARRFLGDGLFDSGMFDLIDRFLDDSGRQTSAPEAPQPLAEVNLVKISDDTYRLDMALPGFREDDIDITVEKDVLTVRGTPADEGETGQYLRRGFSPTAFENRFNLAQHVEVIEASLANGVLSITLKQEIPQAEKPRRIAISGSTPKSTDA